MDSVDNLDEYRKIFADLKAESLTWLPAYTDIKNLVAPTRGFFNDQPNRGKTIDHKNLLDSHATWAMKVLASGMTSGLTSPSRPWFRLAIADNELMKSKAVKSYLEDVQNALMGVFSKSNFYGILNSAYEELASFGTASFSLEEDFKDIVRGKNFTAGEYRIGLDQNGRANQFAREMWYTVSQLVNEFGIDKVSLQTKLAFENKRYAEWVKVYHLISPNYDRDPHKKDNHNMPYYSIYWEQSHQIGQYLQRGGYEDFPIICPRWSVTTTSDIYGKSPAWEGLGDIKMLQKLQRKKFEALDKIIDPPVQVDSSIDDLTVNTLPGGVSRISSSNPNGGVRPAYQINPDLSAIEYSIKATKDSISKFFFTDMFLMMANDTRSGVTAREVIERHEEKLLMLGPILERIENEMLDPCIDRTYGILERSGALPPAPPELQGMHIKVEYISTLAQAQKMVGTTAISQTAQFIGNLAGANPAVLDIFDFDEAAIEYAELVGVSPKIMRSKDEVAKLRQDRAEAQQRQQQMEQTQQMVSGAKVLSDTKVGTNSALDSLLGLRGQQ
jgi:hypothetical protein